MNYDTIRTEKTDDRGPVTTAHSSSNESTYLVRSSGLKDALNTYLKRYERWPSAAWYRKRARWTIKRVYF